MKLIWQDLVYLYAVNMLLRHDHRYQVALDHYTKDHGGYGDAVCLATPIICPFFTDDQDHYETDWEFQVQPGHAAELLDADSELAKSLDQEAIVAKANKVILEFMTNAFHFFQSDTERAFLLITNTLVMKPYDLRAYNRLGKYGRFGFYGPEHADRGGYRGAEILKLMTATGHDAEKAFDNLVEEIQQLRKDWMAKNKLDKAEIKEEVASPSLAI